jgi:hypothetical protein
MRTRSDRLSSPVRFRATIQVQGPNPYVDVPGRVSRALDSFARAARIYYEGTLGRTPIRGSLVPVGQGRHRLFVNGGMRAAAGVGVGDTVSFVIRATPPDVVRPPADVAARLAGVAGARRAFDALSPSHRRELLRFIDDARTPSARRRRIDQTASHVLGRRPSESEPSATPERPLWTCPRCGNRFVTRNMFHSCRRYDLESVFAGRPPHVRELFDRFRALVEACGPVTLLPYKDKVGFMVRVRFAGAAPRKNGLDVGFWLPRRIEHPRCHRVETIVANAHIHLVRVTSPADLDAELAGWIREAYGVGCQKHRGA